MTPVDSAPLLIVTFLGVALVVLLITWLKLPALIALAAGSFVVGLASGMPLADIPRAFQQGVGDTLGFIAMVIGLGTVIGKLLAESGGRRGLRSAHSGAGRAPPGLLGWVIAALLRLSVGSATVACVTAASIMAPIATAMPDVNTDLLVVATGAGSLIASHVNDGGFWLVKEYFNMNVPQTVATWTMLETIIAVAGLAGVLLLAGLVG